MVFRGRRGDGGRPGAPRDTDRQGRARSQETPSVFRTAERRSERSGAQSSIRPTGTGRRRR